MRGLAKAKQEKVRKFRAVTQASESNAINCLRASGWSVEGAVDYFYMSGRVDDGEDGRQAGIDQAFNKYKDESGQINVDGVTRFINDLGVDPTDVVMVVVSYHMGAATMCEFSQEEFKRGFLDMDVDSVAGLKAKLPELRRELDDDDTFASIYNFAFLWACEKGQKILQLDTAVAMWQLLLQGTQAWRQLPDWIAYLQENHGSKAITRDTWTQLLDFIRQIQPDFANYDENGAWPWIIDEYVEHQQSKGE